MKRSQKKPETLITGWPPGVWDAASYMITICSLSSVWAAYHPDPKWQAYQFFSICQCIIALYTSKISGIVPQLAKKWQNLASISFNALPSAVSSGQWEQVASSHTAQPQAGEEGMEDHMDFLAQGKLSIWFLILPQLLKSFFTTLTPATRFTTLKHKTKWKKQAQRGQKMCVRTVCAGVELSKCAEFSERNLQKFCLHFSLLKTLQ